MFLFNRLAGYRVFQTGFDQGGKTGKSLNFTGFLQTYKTRPTWDAQPQVRSKTLQHTFVIRTKSPHFPIFQATWSMFKAWPFTFWTSLNFVFEIVVWWTQKKMYFLFTGSSYFWETGLPPPSPFPPTPLASKSIRSVLPFWKGSWWSK